MFIPGKCKQSSTCFLILFPTYPCFIHSLEEIHLSRSPMRLNIATRSLPASEMTSAMMWHLEVKFQKRQVSHLTPSMKCLWPSMQQSFAAGFTATISKVVHWKIIRILSVPSLQSIPIQSPFWRRSLTCWREEEMDVRFFVCRKNLRSTKC